MKLLLFLLMVIAVPFHGMAAEWTQFRNAQGTGQNPQSTPPLKFEEEHLAWKTPLPGRGWSSPVVIDSQLWVTTAMAGGRSLRVLGVDLNSGRLLHDVELFRISDPIEIHRDNSYASPTPCVDEKRVYAHFGAFGTAAVDRETGEIVWSTKQYVVDHQGGPGSSPALLDDLLILTYDGVGGQFVVALNTATGEEVWKRDRSAPLRENPITHRAFASPLLLQQQQQTLLISPAADQMHAYNARTGEELWHVRYIGFSNVPQPVQFENMVLLCTGFYDTQLWAVELGGGGNVTDSHVAWKYEKKASTIPTPLVYGSKVYHLSEKGVLLILDAQTGELLKRNRLRGNFSASPIATQSHIWCCSEEGNVIVLDPEQDCEIVANNHLELELKATPLPLEKGIVIRTESDLRLYQQ